MEVRRPRPLAFGLLAIVASVVAGGASFVSRWRYEDTYRARAGVEYGSLGSMGLEWFVQFIPAFFLGMAVVLCVSDFLSWPQDGATPRRRDGRES